MHSMAMSSTEHNLWTIANILGLVVVVAVAALLSLLIYLVKTIDRRVVAVRDTLEAAAATTTTMPRMFAVSHRLCSVEDMASVWCIATLPAWRGRTAGRR